MCAKVHKQASGCPSITGIKANPDIFISHTSLSKPSTATNQSARTKVPIDQFSNKKKKKFVLFITVASFFVLEGVDLELAVAGLLFLRVKKI